MLFSLPGMFSFLPWRALAGFFSPSDLAPRPPSDLPRPYVHPLLPSLQLLLYFKRTFCNLWLFFFF